jgi:hypothetical protein
MYGLFPVVLKRKLRVTGHKKSALYTHSAFNCFCTPYFNHKSPLKDDDDWPLVVSLLFLSLLSCSRSFTLSASTCSFHFLIWISHHNGKPLLPFRFFSCVSRSIKIDCTGVHSKNLVSLLVWILNPDLNPCNSLYNTPGEKPARPMAAPTMRLDRGPIWI